HLTADIEIDGVVRGEVGVCYAPDHTFIEPEEQDLVNAVAEALALWLQRRHALARMAESESRFRAMFENALDCIVLFDDEGRFLEVNESASALFGMSRDELVQRCAEDFTVGPNDLAEAWTALRRDGSISGRWPLKLPSGEIRNTEFTSVANIAPHCHLCVFRDVTDRIASQQELQESYDALRRADTQRRRLLAQLVSAHEEERFRIANDIHDDSIQVMTAVGMRLTILRKELEVGSDADLKKLEDTVEKAIKRLRHLLFELRPAALDRDGLVPALRQYLDMMLEQGGPVVSLEHDLAREPSPDTRILVFRLLQEALQNVRKHARASNVRIVVSSEKDGIRVGVRDDGKGFDTAESTIALPGHLGLASMHERADLAGGWVRIESGRGEGTLVEFWVPDATGGSTGAPSDEQATFGA
ncbi:MAG: PAS domain S-box protein, partial [Actinomycetota bacterium]